MKKKSGFEKFYSGEKKGGAKKEQLRQEKRKWKKELTEKKEARKKSLEPRMNNQTAKPPVNDQLPAVNSSPMPLNKYIAHCGVCSRRDAVDLIKGGKVRVNDHTVAEPGYKVNPKDAVSVAGK